MLLTRNRLPNPPPQPLPHLSLFFGARIHGGRRGPALGEQRAPRRADDRGERRCAQDVRVEEVREEPREEGRAEGAEQGEQVRERAGGRVRAVCRGRFGGRGGRGERGAGGVSVRTLTDVSLDSHPMYSVCKS